MASTKIEGRAKRKLRIRKKMDGTMDRPRLSVFRSAKHIYAQLVDDAQGKTLLTVSTLSKDVRDGIGEANKTDAAKKVGTAVAQACLAKGIKKVVFDRSGARFHGKVKALADAAREAGLQF